MEQSDKRAFQAAIKTLGVAFRTVMDTPLIQAYWMGLEDQQLRHVEEAVRQCIREKEYLPTVAKLRELARMAARQLMLFEERKLIEAEEAATKPRIAESWRGHEEELEQMRQRLKAMAEEKAR